MVAVAAALIMVLSMSMVSVNASENDAETRARLCPNCGNRMSKMQKYTSSRYVDVPCKHGKNGLDREFQKLRVVGEKCVTCGVEAVLESEWITMSSTCNGY